MVDFAHEAHEGVGVGVVGVESHGDEVGVSVGNVEVLDCGLRIRESLPTATIFILIYDAKSRRHGESARCRSRRQHRVPPALRILMSLLTG